MIVALLILLGILKFYLLSINQNCINPSTSGIQISVELPILSEHERLVSKYRENLKLPERPLDLNTLFNAKLVALLNEEDPMLSPIVKALQDEEKKIRAIYFYLNQFIRDLHE